MTVLSDTAGHPLLLVGGGYGQCAYPAGHEQGCRLVGEGVPAFTVTLVSDGA